MLIDPALESPRRYIRFREAVPYPVLGSSRGAKTIEVLGLKSPSLREARRKHLFCFQMLRAVAAGMSTMVNAKTAQSYLAIYESERGPFTSCVKDNFYVTTLK
jgi:hypothetical protein